MSDLPGDDRRKCADRALSQIDDARSAKKNDDRDRRKRIDRAGGEPGNNKGTKVWHYRLPD
ncbi:MAG TPA: hypothetical protein VJS63_02300 [Bradyrhizobium sp.]|nr:hypothetical protein [Bradyrhizobium sp.]